jgi:hypothetical protein
MTERLPADCVAACLVCKGPVPANPWDVMMPDLTNHGPFCSRLCLQDFCGLYDLTHEDPR